MKIKIMLLLGVMTFFGKVSAQRLLQPLEEFPMSNQAYVVMKSGEVLSGRIVWTSSNRGISKVNLEDQNGEKHKVSASEIEEMAIAINGAVKVQYAMERGSSVKKLLSKDFFERPDDYIIFKNISLNGNKEILLQQLNPSFDLMFEVFYDPFARKTTALEGEHIAWTGDKHRAFLVSKNGSEPIKVKKGRYKRSFRTLFGDCRTVMALQKPKFQDLGTHILLYQSACQGS